MTKARILRWRHDSESWGGAQFSHSVITRVLGRMRQGGQSQRRGRDKKGRGQTEAGRRDAVALNEKQRPRARVQEVDKAS